MYVEGKILTLLTPRFLKLRFMMIKYLLISNLLFLGRKSKQYRNIDSFVLEANIKLTEWVSESVSQWVSESVSQSVSQSVSKSVSQSVSQWVSKSVSQSVSAAISPTLISCWWSTISALLSTILYTVANSVQWNCWHMGVFNDWSELKLRK